MKEVHNTDPNHLLNSLNNTLPLKEATSPQGSIIVGGKSGTNQEIIVPNKTTFVF